MFLPNNRSFNLFILSKAINSLRRRGGWEWKNMRKILLKMMMIDVVFKFLYRIWQEKRNRKWNPETKWSPRKETVWIELTDKSYNFKRLMVDLIFHFDILVVNSIVFFSCVLSYYSSFYKLEYLFFRINHFLKFWEIPFRSCYCLTFNSS